ncbi:unnamed protein product [Tetraodon nigroviridis]|uniref:(spotted green pufferfish) hypothetical protein n=1 Tax=Tetraodon nigroviridis TaxID=99883 RepID=Q4S9D4_TETNG|nr:unnamed protein product [Tetraodon nigroviridis]
MGHAFITRSPFHQPFAPLLSLPTAEPSVPEVSVMGDNMSPRPCDIKNTYTCCKLVGQIGGHDDRAAAASTTWGPQL